MARRVVGPLLVAALSGMAACGGEQAAPGSSDSTAVTATAGPEAPFRTGSVEVDSLIAEKETHLAGLRQLTFGGQNAEAYWSPDDERLIFQATPRDASCDQEYVMSARGEDLRLVSTGEGRTTCGYFVPGRDRIIYSSTHLASPDCPPPPDFSQGYVWALYPGYDIFEADADGSDPVRLTATPGYDAEATISRDGEWIVFTSMRDGDLDIYKMRVDGTDVTRLTDAVGYDGGPFFSYDGSQIVYRAYHPETAEEIAEYRDLLDQNLIRPSKLDIWVMNTDGSGKRRLTDNGAANFGPYFFPDGQRVIFASNMGDPTGREFDLYAIGVDGTGMERITWTPDFDGFPMFNSDGTQLVFASNRGNELPHETNLFIADWVN